jgi:hypothetical protein
MIIVVIGVIIFFRIMFNSFRINLYSCHLYVTLEFIYVTLEFTLEFIYVALNIIEYRIEIHVTLEFTLELTLKFMSH